MDKTKFMALVLLTTLLVAVTALFAGCGSKENSLTEDDMSQPVELVWYCMGPPPVDLPLVMEKLNDYTKQKLNCTVKLNMIDYGDYGTKMKMIALSNENYDIAFTCNWAFDYNRNAASGTVLSRNALQSCWIPVRPSFGVAQKFREKPTAFPITRLRLRLWHTISTRACYRE